MAGSDESLVWRLRLECVISLHAALLTSEKYECIVAYWFESERLRIFCLRTGVNYCQERPTIARSGWTGPRNAYAGKARTERAPTQSSVKRE